MSPAITPTPSSESYNVRRAWIAEYFDRTASKTWAALTSDAPVSGIRRTVRLGRERMAATILGMLPPDLAGRRVLDAGCGPGGLAIALAARGADVVGVDLAGSLLDVARARMEGISLRGRVQLRAGDMLDPAHGSFDYVVAMDSLIHYQTTDMLQALGTLASRTRIGMVVTFAPSTPLLSMLHAVGKAFPRRDRAPSIEPVREASLRAGVLRGSEFVDWRLTTTVRISSGFYKSQAVKLCREPAIADARHSASLHDVSTPLSLTV